MRACDLGGSLGSDGPRVGAELIDVRQLSQPRHRCYCSANADWSFATEMVFCVCCSQSQMLQVLKLEVGNDFASS